MVKKIEKAQRDFLWGKERGKIGPHLVAWEEIYKPKRNGGLGIRRIQEVNIALLSKWLWRSGNEHDNLWRQVIASKYGLVNAWETKSPTSSHGVICWKGIMWLMEGFKTAIWVEVGNGRNTSFWTDTWCSNQPLCVEAPHIYAMA